MMQRRFSREEQNIARGVNLALLCGDYDPYRFTVTDKGYLLDNENPDWVYSISRLWWYDNGKNPKHGKNGNAIDWIMSEGYTFPEAMTILLTYADGGDWKQYLRNNKTELDFVPVESYDYGDDLPFN